MKHFLIVLVLSLSITSAFGQKPKELRGRHWRVDKSPIPTYVPLSTPEQPLAPIFECLQSFLEKNRGGYDQFRVAVAILRDAFDNDILSQDPAKLKSVLETCQSYTIRIQSVSADKLDPVKLNEQFDLQETLTLAEKKSAAVVKILKWPVLKVCSIRRTGLMAGALVIPSLSTSHIECLTSDGNVYRIKGVSFRLLVGGPAVAVFSDRHPLETDGEVPTGFMAHRGDEKTLVVLGPYAWAHLPTRYDQDLIPSGLYFGFAPVSREWQELNIGHKVKKSKDRRWKMLVDLLH